MPRDLKPSAVEPTNPTAVGSNFLTDSCHAPTYRAQAGVDDDVAGVVGSAERGDDDAEALVVGDVRVDSGPSRGDERGRVRVGDALQKARARRAVPREHLRRVAERRRRKLNVGVHRLQPRILRTTCT